MEALRRLGQLADHVPRHSGWNEGVRWNQGELSNVKLWDAIVVFVVIIAIMTVGSRCTTGRRTAPSLPIGHDRHGHSSHGGNDGTGGAGNDDEFANSDAG
jgi:hypothetical protein